MRFSWQKIKGIGADIPARLNKRQAIFAVLGAFIAVYLLEQASNLASVQMIMASFGATIALTFGYPNNPFSQPRNIIGGHFIGSLTGLLLFHSMGVDPIAIASAVSAAILLMIVFNVMHPPAVANTVIVFFSQASWSFLVFPTLIGTILIVLTAILFHNLRHDAHYPLYW